MKTIFSISFLWLLWLVSASAFFHGNPPVITISGNTLMKDGAIWAPKGANIYGFNRAPNKVNATFLTYQSYFPTELYYIKNVLHGDIVRFNISQQGLDPSSSIYDATYPAQLVNIVNQTILNGFVVILGMNSQASTGGVATCMPGADTGRAWQTIIPYFKSNPSVLFGIFNEPCEDTSAPSQTDWVTDTNAVIATIRASGANNILILNGLNFGRYTNGLGSRVVDSANKWVFGVHPYLTSGFTTSGNWDSFFGTEAATYPTIVDEWIATPTLGCVASEPTIAANLISYLKTHGGSAGLGVLGWASDFLAAIFVDQTGYVLTSYTGWTACSDGTTTGPGTLISGY